MPLRVCRYTSAVLLALMLPCAGKFAKAQDQDNGASSPLALVYDCSRILQAEASVGNLVAALRTCGLAREKLLKRSLCDSAKDDCGNASTDPIIRMLDKRLEDARKTDTYRKLASEEIEVSTAPATK
jgi:hypothetical protein